jgi:uncharacterized cupin superfamily protein
VSGEEEAVTAQGPFVSSVDADTWEPFEVGDGRVIGEVHFLRAEDDGSFYAGLWRMPGGDLPDPFDYEMAQNETIHVLEGEVELAVADGPTLHLKAGDLASFRAGTRTRWTLRAVPFKELFVLS